MTDLELLEVMLDKPIAFHRIFLLITAEKSKSRTGSTGKPSLKHDIDAALFASQAYYWSKAMNHQWFYKTAESWEEETGLSKFQQMRVRKKLSILGLLEEERRGVPCTVHFKFNREKFVQLARLYYQQLSRNLTTENEGSKQMELPVVKKLNNQWSRNSPTITENNTENKKNKKEKSYPQISEVLTDAVLAWGNEKGVSTAELKEHAEFFINYAKGHGLVYEDPIAMFMNAVIANYAGVGGSKKGSSQKKLLQAKAYAAWNHMKSEVDKWGFNNVDQRYFDDVRIHEVIKKLGGWSWFRSPSLSQLPLVEKDFVRVYLELQE